MAALAPLISPTDAPSQSSVIKGILMRVVIGFIFSIMLVGQAIAQSAERSFTVTLTESQWNAIGKIVSKAKDVTWEDTNPIMQAILAQIGQGLQQDAQARQRAAAENEQLKSEIERLKGELQKSAPAPQEPEKP